MACALQRLGLRRLGRTHNHVGTNGPLSNLPQFHDAFGVADGDALYRKPDERVMVW